MGQELGLHALRRALANASEALPPVLPPPGSARIPPENCGPRPQDARVPPGFARRFPAAQSSVSPSWTAQATAFKKADWVAFSLAGSTIFDIVYGIDVHPDNDSYFGVIEKAVGVLSIVGNSGIYLGACYLCTNRC